jgi:acetolactate synthase I/II/III large subunit
MRDLLHDYFDGRLSRRGFFQKLVATGLTASAAHALIQAADLGSVETAAESATRAYLQTGTGADLLAEQVRAAGSRHIFTNPGSMETPFFDALTDRPELQVIVGLHEGIVISMADGYYKTTLQPAFVNVHAAVGTAQASGQLYNAASSALVVTAGMDDITVRNDETGLGAKPGYSQTEINRQFTKLSWEVRTGPSSALAIRRAYKLASTLPCGPVYVAYSTAALTATGVKADIWPREHFLVQARPRPAADQVEALARMLLEAKLPVPTFGDEVWKSGAQAEAVQLCELLGVPGTSAPLGDTFTNFPFDHPQRLQGDAATAFPGHAPDLLVSIGASDSGSVNLDALDTMPRFAAVGIDANKLGRARPFDLAVVGDARETLKATIDAVKSLATRDRLTKIRQERLDYILPAIAAARANRLQAARANFDANPIHPDRLDYELGRATGGNAILVEENFSQSHDFFRFGYRPDDTMRLVAPWSLGWGIGAAIGAKIGAPNRQVVLSIGDGAVMYSSSGFWTMARYEVPVLTVIANNHNYQMVRNGYVRYKGRMAATGHYHGAYLGDPDIDFIKLAESQGVGGIRVTSAADLEAALQRGVRETREGRPFVIDVIVARVGGGAESTWHQKYSVAKQATNSAL